MDYVADLHLHSRYSRAVSPAMNLTEMARWARWKGLHILSAADFTHPLWIREAKAQLEESNEGLYKIKDPTFAKASAGKQKGPLFLLSTEIACIYKQGEKLRRIHNLFFAPSLEVVEKFSEALLRRGANLSADGRPIIGMTSHDLLELALTIDRRMILIPAHVWTPHFGIYGSASGFDSLQEAFGDLSKFIYGIETGLSSDPLMNWQISELDNRSILSFSDAHSLPKMGREATIFSFGKDGIANTTNFKFPISNEDLEKLTYTDIGKAIAGPMKAARENGQSSMVNGQSHHIAYTIEFYPEEGKYHYSGHRNCGVSKTPEEIKKDGNICPVCKRKLTEGVMVRVGQLSDEKSNLKNQISKIDEDGVCWIEDPRKIHPPFVKLVPLNEIIAESITAPVTSPKTKLLFEQMCETLGSEITVLLKTPIPDIESKFSKKIAEGVDLVRRGGISVIPGFDGEYGKVRIWNEEKETKGAKETDETKGEKKEQLGLDF